ncbi:glyoxalase [Mucilaginibacter sp. MD40]|uniref:glyoxalase n=1 Tax=Mucilaginibacter sp. MD40 TaxID=2029590 RepID=UPI000BACACAA|nr:glyoxalase [Mucilaginibacter sp. MD40]PAW94419.1 glyoxalase [Mucilaginibacter sp. MD40]
MQHNAKGIRPFIGAKDFDLSRAFYREWGFEEFVISPDMSVFKLGDTAFYLQKYYNKDWVDNTMVFMEVDNAQRYYEELQALDLPSKYPGSRVSPVRVDTWGDECFVHDPSGVLWHIGHFKR